MRGYETNISLATEESKELEKESETETLLNIISSKTHQHQEVLRSVYDKVPEEAKEAILKAIEVSQKRQEEADRQIRTLKKEVAQLRDEIGELQKKLEEKSAEQKPSPAPIQKTNNEIKKPTQISVPPTITPSSDKSLKNLKEELERKLREIENTPLPTPVISTSPTPIPTPRTIPQPSISPDPTPAPPAPPTPVPVFLKSDEFIATNRGSQIMNPDGTYSDNYQLKVIGSTDSREDIKSITFELYYNNHTTLLDLNICKPYLDVTRKSGRILANSMPITSNPFTWNVFTPLVLPPNTPTMPLDAENHIRISLACLDPTKTGEELMIYRSIMETDKIIYLRILSADGAIIERN